MPGGVLADGWTATRVVNAQRWPEWIYHAPEVSLQSHAPLACFLKSCLPSCADAWQGFVTASGRSARASGYKTRRLVAEAMGMEVPKKHRRYKHLPRQRAAAQPKAARLHASAAKQQQNGAAKRKASAPSVTDLEAAALGKLRAYIQSLGVRCREALSAAYTCWPRLEPAVICMCMVGTQWARSKRVGPPSSASAMGSGRRAPCATSSGRPGASRVARRAVSTQ